MAEQGHAPKSLAYLSVPDAVAHPSYLKMHDWVTLAGCLGKYALRGCLGVQQRKGLFAFLDVLSRLWAKTIKAADVEKLKRELQCALVCMEVAFPAWELDITRHMLLHMVEQIPVRGPLWAWSMWPYERLWHRMLQWKNQDTNPEATMANAFKAFKVADSLLSRWDEDDAGRAEAQRCSYFQTFDRQTNSLLLPAYLEEPGYRSVKLRDEKKRECIFSSAHRKVHMQLELHAYYLQFADGYKEAWTAYLAAQGVSAASLEGSRVATRRHLMAWPRWAVEQGLEGQQKDFAYGPHLYVYPHDRAEINGISFASERMARGTKAKNDIVMIVTARLPDGRPSHFQVGILLTHSLQLLWKKRRCL